jgi:hypothetical protein
MPHQHRQPVGNPDGVSESSHHRVGATSPGPQRPQRTVNPNEHWEVPVSNPAELAAYAENTNAGESEHEQSYVDLGVAVDSTQTAEVDGGDPLGVDDHVDLDAA